MSGSALGVAVTLATGWDDTYQAWGRTQRSRHLVAKPRSVEAAQQMFAAGGAPILAYGCGRSYGDTPLNPEGRLIDCRGLDRFISFDTATGVLVAETGVRLADVLAVISRPEESGAGWFPPVSPGTRFVTLGGLVANDIHGKNHARFGTFGRHVLWFDLARTDGRVLRCAANENAGTFAATIGGLGLTGLILRVALQMRRVEGLNLESEDIRFGDLNEFFALEQASLADWEYCASWVDCGGGGARGRGIFTRSRHIAGRADDPPSRRPSIELPLTPPISPLNGLTVRSFNAAYLRRLGAPSRIQRGGYEAALYPLDAIGSWHRLYGPKGFYQFQCVVPPAEARASIAALLTAIAGSGEGSILSVLKSFGDLASPGIMSFPMPGVTLALDFPERGAATKALLARLEAIVVEAKGRLYPAKDGAMSAEAFQRGYPQIERFREHLDPGVSSAFAKRVGLIAAQ